VVGISPECATGSERESLMDYIIAGIVAGGLFIYLLYALLKPERF
jgi:K+-transporting ATPase KdpF subunit